MVQVTEPFICIIKDPSINTNRGVTSEPLCEIKFLNLWKYLWLHHLSGEMSLVSADLVILPPGHRS